MALADSTRPPQRYCGRVDGRQRAKFWEFNALPRFGRVAVLAVIVVALLADAVTEFASETSSPSSLVDVGLFFAVGLFVWRPPVAAVALVLGGAVALGVGDGGPYVLGLAAVSGLAIYTCSGWLAAVYCGMLGIWILVAQWASQGITEGGSIATFAVGLASGLIGSAFRIGHLREEQLVADVDRLTQDTIQAIQSERDRIADELHNIIAHDITIVVMHARALELIDDHAERIASTRAISDAARQALTDVRRMLHVVQNIQDSTDEYVHTNESVGDRLRAIRDELRAMGARVQLSVSERIEVSSSIRATLGHIVSECSTNIMKHAPQAPVVDISLVATADSITLSIWNAPDPNRAKHQAGPSGYGLKRMSDRVTLHGGVLTVEGDDRGWLVLVELPSS